MKILKVNKIYSMLGLAKKAGNLLLGNDVCEKGLKAEKIKLIILSKDCSDRTAKNFTSICLSQSIPYRIFGDKYSLGKFTGKDEVAVAGLCDSQFADVILNLIDESAVILGGEKNGEN